MLQYEKICISEGIDTNKTSALKECMLCYYWYFKGVGFKFKPHVCNKCHDVLMTAYELKNIAILNVKIVDFRCILWGASRDEAVIEYFEDGGKNMSFLIKDDVLDKYNEIWDKIKETLSMKFHSTPVYDEKHIKAKVREFSDVIKTKFLSDEVPKENEH